jgi:uridine phosphorylase
MPSRLRPTAPFAAEAILVGDPGRALLLAQELLERPKMSNHARGLWGYSGRTASGHELTIQATGMGGPSAALVLGDLAKLGVERAVRVGTCASLGSAALGELLLVERALAAGGSAGAFGLDVGAATQPDRQLLAALRPELDRQEVTIASSDTMATSSEAPREAIAVDMQTVAVLACARRLGIAAAAILIVSEAGGERLEDEKLETAAKLAGHAAVRGLSR